MSSNGYFWASRCSFVVLSKCTTKTNSKSKVRPKRATVCTRVRTRSVFLNLFMKKRLWLEHVCEVCSKLVLLLRFCSVFRVGTFFGPFGPLGWFFRDFYRDFTAIIENCVRETAVGVHFGAQNCGKNGPFNGRLDKNSVFCDSSVCLAPDVLHFRCGFTANSAYQAFHWDSTIV